MSPSLRQRFHLPRWAPYAAFVVVVAAIVAYSAVSRSSDSPTTKAKLVNTKNLPPRSTPEGVVLRWWRGIQTGSFPVSVSLYEPRVRDALGDDIVTGALSAQRFMLLQTRPVVESSSQTDLGVELTLKGTTGDSAAPSYYSFLLGRSGSTWEILYDSILGEAVGQYVQAQEQTRIAPDVKSPSPEAVKAGQQATLKYRNLFLRSEGGRRSSETEAGGSDGNAKSGGGAGSGSSGSTAKRTPQPRSTPTPTATP